MIDKESSATDMLDAYLCQHGFGQRKPVRAATTTSTREHNNARIPSPARSKLGPSSSPKQSRWQPTVNEKHRHDPSSSATQLARQAAARIHLNTDPLAMRIHRGQQRLVQLHSMEAASLDASPMQLTRPAATPPQLTRPQQHSGAFAHLLQQLEASEPTFVAQGVEQPPPLRQQGASVLHPNFFDTATDAVPMPRSTARPAAQLDEQARMDALNRAASTLASVCSSSSRPTPRATSTTGRRSSSASDARSVAADHAVHRQLDLWEAPSRPVARWASPPSCSSLHGSTSGSSDALPRIRRPSSWTADVAVFEGAWRQRLQQTEASSPALASGSGSGSSLSSSGANKTVIKTAETDEWRPMRWDAYFEDARARVAQRQVSMTPHMEASGGNGVQVDALAARVASVLQRRHASPSVEDG